MAMHFNASKMRRYLLPLLLGTIIIMALLRKSGMISAANLMYSLLIPAILECFFIIYCLLNIVKLIKRYKTLKKAGWETFDALQKSFELVLTPRLARLATIEPRLYYALYLSYKHKRDENHSQFMTRINAYAFFVKVIILLCLLEIAAVSLLLPNKWLIWKLIHLILGLWAILWLWSDYRAMGLYHHLITPEGMRFRLGLRYDRSISWEDIQFVRKTFRAPPDGALMPQIAKKDQGLFYLGAGEACNLEIHLKEPCCFPGMINDFKNVKRLLLSLEEPDDFISRIHAIQPELCSLA